jgi:hypothetical protein
LKINNYINKSITIKIYSIKNIEINNINQLKALKINIKVVVEFNNIIIMGKILLSKNNLSLLPQTKNNKLQSNLPITCQIQIETPSNTPKNQ